MLSSKELNIWLNTTSVDEIWDLNLRRMAGYGFDRLIYGATRYRTATSLGDPDDFIILTNHSQDYTDRFIGEGMYFHAPILHWALQNDGACSWSLLREMARTGTITADERKVMEFNQSHGVNAGYSISFPSATPWIKAVIALTARTDLSQEEVDAIWAEHGADIEVLNTIAHLRILSLPYATPARSLTARQREVLAWVGDGKTVQDIALLMDLTPATVEKHLRLAREALCVETTAQAVLKTAMQNQVFSLRR